MVLFTKVHKNQSFMFEEFVEITEVFGGYKSQGTRQWNYLDATLSPKNILPRYFACITSSKKSCICINILAL